ncbi:MAG: glycosyltransferase family 4 protein [Bacteroidetes bacterium]|nr:glycosyltransferase family 4 protein [Bacteroidota bacterium]
MKILWIAHEGLLSGSNICLLEYIDILSSLGYQQEVIVPSFGEFVSQLHDRKIHVAKIPYYGWATSLTTQERRMTKIRKWARNKIAVRNISAIIKKMQPDYVATNTIVVPVGAIAAKKAAAKHIWFVHEFGEEDHGFTIDGNFSSGAKTINRLSAKVVFNSEATEKKFSPFIDMGKKFIVYNAVKIVSKKHEVNTNHEAFKLIMLGQIAPSKNQEEAIEALALCRSRGIDAELTIIGRSENEKYFHHLEKIVENATLKEYVHFTGTSKQPWDLLVKSHALLMCSRMEAFGRVTVEAMKCGIPVIAANTGGSLEIIDEGADGYFYKAGDYNDLAESIMKLYKNYHLFDKKKIAAKAEEKFNEKNTAAQLQKVFC